jgi:DNA-directed RNA polymerase subunit beta'
MPEEYNFKAIRIKLASPEEIKSWSHGEVTKPETINYRTQRPEKEGLFSESIFGPTKDYECYCGKYKRIRFKGIVCDKCGVEVTKASVRRERMGHIELAVPVAHIWFLSSIPSRIGMLLDVSSSDLNRVIYFAGYMITKINEDARNDILERIDKEYKSKIKSKNKKSKDYLKSLKEIRDKAISEVNSIKLFHVLSESEYQRLSARFGELFEASMGAEAVRRAFESLDLNKLNKELVKELENAPAIQHKKIIKRINLIQSLIRSNVRPENMLLTILPVLPPDLRPMVQLDGGRYASSDLNDLYRRVINRNNRLKKLQELKAPDVIQRNEKRMLQEAVDALIDNASYHGQRSSPMISSKKRPLRSLSDMLRGKQGRFRQNLLGKRVDYSGRSVIVVGPNLKLDECGLPKRMALELFKPFVIHNLLEQGLAHNVRGAGRLIEDGPPEVWAALEDVIKDRKVLLNRAPTLHRLGVQAFYPRLIEGMAIELHPLVCRAFNADFDGDQMAVHLPLSQEAQDEAENKMLSSHNLLKPATGEPVVNPTKDMVLGIYWITKINPNGKGAGKFFSSKNEAVLAYSFEKIDINSPIKILIKPEKRQGNEKFLETSVGRIFFNKAFPNDMDFINKEMKSKDLEEVVGRIIERYGMEEASKILDGIKSIGFSCATISGISWGMDDLSTPETKSKIIQLAEKEVKKINDQYESGFLTNEESYKKIIEVWTEAKSKVAAEVKKSLDPLGSAFIMVDSGARGSWTQITQMAGMKGLVQNPAGDIIRLPVKASFKEGFDVLEYFISTHGARKGTADTALRTSAAGYLTRRLVDVSQDVVVREEDCHDSTGIMINRKDTEEMGKSFTSRLFGRILIQDIKDKSGKILIRSGEIIDEDKARIIEDLKLEEVNVRSVITCKSVIGVCRKCYGYDLGNNKLVEMGEAVGIVAAQAIGEPGTQLTMRTFHTGGVASGGDITQGLPRVEEVFEARTPNNPAPISEVDGVVVEIKDEGKNNVVCIAPKSKESKKSPPASLSHLSAGKQSKRAKNNVREYEVPKGFGLFVEEGSEVSLGQQLCEGHVDMKSLFKVAGEGAIYNYILKEVQKIYTFQGAHISDKHIEVIIRQMFSRVRIKDSGDTSFSVGEIEEMPIFLRENLLAKNAGKRPAVAQRLLLGITKVSLTTNSFLSAASFQETSRVLISASLRGKVDYLKGLKENVIVGRLIPAGRGYNSQNDAFADLELEEEIKEAYKPEAKKKK